jgi:hypothetical protein
MWSAIVAKFSRRRTREAGQQEDPNLTNLKNQQRTPSEFQVQHDKKKQENSASHKTDEEKSSDKTPAQIVDDETNKGCD